MESTPRSSKPQNEYITNDRMVVTILVAAAIGLTIIGIAIWLSGDNNLVAMILLVSVLIDVACTILAYRGITFPGRILIPGILTFAAGFIAFTRGGLYHISVAAFPVVIVLAGLLIGIRGSFFFAALASILAAFIGYADINGISPFSATSRTGYDDIVVAATLFFTTAIVLRVIIHRMTESAQEIREFASAQEIANIELKELQSELENRVAERTKELDKSNQRNESRARQFEAIAQVARSISTTQNFDVLLPRITNLISLEFGFYHVGIFLLDSRKEYAVLSAANSEGGQRMLDRNHRLRVGEMGIVGYVTGSGKARVALDTGADAVFFNNPDLPETRSEIALPLRLGQEVIGALDVQSRESNAFNDEDINVLGTLADQVSIAIQNARQFEATQKALTESETLTRQFVRTGWQSFTRRENLLGVRHTGAKASLLYAKSKKGKGEEPDSSNREQNRSRARGTSLTLPVKLRGEVIGTVDIRSTTNRQFDQDELDIVTAIIERAAIAMENSRLLEDAQRRAAKERAVGEISAKISMQSDIDGLLKVAAQELNRTLPGTEIAIQVRREETE